MEPLKVKGKEILELYEPSEETLGKPFYFNLDNHIIAVEQLIASDEIEMALKLMDMVPAWYRANYPLELERMKRILYENMYDQYEYASDDEEAGYTREKAEAQAGSAYTFPRFEILSKVVRDYNEQGKVPWYFEASPSHGLLPLGLARDGLKFKFFGKNLNHKALVKLIEWLGPEIWHPQGPGPDQPTIFGCFESLEHASREEDLFESYVKLGVDFDDVLLSVPNGTLGGGLPNWKERRIGHLRTYTQKEFVQMADRFFPKRSWNVWPSVSIVVHGKRV